MAEITKLKVPVWNGTDYVVTEFTVKDATAREMIQSLGDSVYWIGVTTTALTDGATTTPITVNGESVAPNRGGMAQYSGEEFVWNGSAWQSVGQNNFGTLAFKNSASGTVTAEGSVSVELVGNSETIKAITGVGTLPSFTVNNEKATFSAGTLPTMSANKTVVTSVAVDDATFTGTSVSVSVS